MNSRGSIEVCRACATPSEKGSVYTPLFELSEPIKCVSKDITEIIEMLQLKFKQNDGLPQKICFSCLKTLAVISEFRKRCEDVQKMLSFYHKSAQQSIIPKRARNHYAEKNEQLKKANIARTYENLIADNGTDDCGNGIPNSGHVSINSKTNNNHMSIDLDLIGENTGYVIEKTEIEFIDEALINGISSDDDYEELNINDTNWKCEFSIDSNDANGKELPSSSTIQINDIAKNIQEETTSTKKQMPKKEKSQCPYCFGFYQVMINHLRSCSARAKHICKYCDLGFETSTTLNEHVEKMHPEGLPACHICFATFDNIKVRGEHVRREHRKVEFKCEKCGREFRSKVMRDEHMERKHTEKINKKCDLCNKIIKTEFLFRRHLKQHEMADKLKCRFCGKIFTRMQFKLKHERIHTGETPFLCEMCGQGFLTLVELNRHKTYTHMEDENAGNEIGLGKRIRSCYKLKKRFGPLRFKCAMCPREFATSYGLNHHLKMHTEDRKYVCEQCGNRFHRLVHLKGHELRMHAKVKRFSCPICGKMFCEKPELNVHMPVHQEERPFECPHCPARFKQQRRLKYHLAKHSTAEPYVCQCCGKAFKLLRNLKTHFQAHTVEEIKAIERKLLYDMENSMEANRIAKIDEENMIEESESKQIEFDYTTEI